MENKIAGHHRLNDKMTALLEGNDNGLSAAGDFAYGFLFKGLGELIGSLTADHPTVDDSNFRNGFADDELLEVSADSFNFGEFGHNVLNTYRARSNPVKYLLGPGNRELRGDR